MSNENKHDITYVPESDVAAVRAELNAEKKDRKSFVKRAMAIGALAGTLMGIGGTKAVEALGHNDELDKSSNTRVVNRVVEPGDTLWEISEDVAPNQDPRDTVDMIEEANPELATRPLQSGEVIHVPIDSSLVEHDQK